MGNAVELLEEEVRGAKEKVAHVQGALKAEEL